MSMRKYHVTVEVMAMDRKSAERFMLECIATCPLRSENGSAGMVRAITENSPQPTCETIDHVGKGPCIYQSSHAYKSSEMYAWKEWSLATWDEFVTCMPCMPRNIVRVHKRNETHVWVKSVVG